MDEDEDWFENAGMRMEWLDENGNKSEGKDCRRIDKKGDEGGGSKYSERVERGRGQNNG